MAGLYSMVALLYIIFFSKGSGYPYKVKVSKITSTSVSLSWKSTELLVQEFTIHCSGIQYYQTADGEVHNSMHVKLQYVPKGLGHVIIGGLGPNYNYTCTIAETVEEGAQVFNGQLSKPVMFRTDYAAPQEPKVPTIKKEDGVTYITLNKPESFLKSGPITGYVIQFHLTPDTSLSDIPIEKEHTEPFGKFSPINFDLARATPQPVSFQIEFKRDLPKHIQLNRNLMRGALKNGAVYRVVTVAYIKCKDSTILFTSSKPSVSFVAVGLDRAAGEPGYNATPNHVKFAIVAGILLPLFCLMYMCCISIVLLCREHYLDLKYDKLDTRSCIKRSLDFLRRGLLIMYLMCSTCLSRCKKCKKGFETLPLSGDEIFYSCSQEKTFDSNLYKKSSRVDKVTQEIHPSKIYHSNKPVKHLHHYKSGHDLHCYDTNRVKDQPKTYKYHKESVNRKRTCVDTEGHHSKQHQTTSHGTKVGRDQGIKNTCLPPEVLAKPLVREIKKRGFPVVSKSHSSGNFSHHDSSRFRPSRDHNGQHNSYQDSSRFKHQPSHKPFEPFSTQYCRDNFDVTAQQPTKSSLQHSSDASPHSHQQPVKPTTQTLGNSSRRIFQSRTPLDYEDHSLKCITKPNAPCTKTTDRDTLSHYQQQSNTTASKSHQKMQRDQFIMESSGNSLSSEDINGTYDLHYTTSASGFEKPFSSATDRYYSPFEFDKETLVSTSSFTKSSNSAFIPICLLADKTNILSPTENFELISLSSNTTMTGCGDLDSVMDVLH